MGIMGGKEYRDVRKQGYRKNSRIQKSGDRILKYWKEEDKKVSGPFSFPPFSFPLFLFFRPK